MTLGLSGLLDHTLRQHHPTDPGQPRIHTPCVCVCVCVCVHVRVCVYQKTDDISQACRVKRRRVEHLMEFSLCHDVPPQNARVVCQKYQTTLA